MSILDSFPAPEKSHIATFQTDELTALCPFEFGGPDHYSVTIRYEASNLSLESKSLKKWMESQRGREISAEVLATELYTDIDGEIEPTRLYIRLEQARRGGIEETVEVGDRTLYD